MLNRRSIRIKAMQTLYALDQGRKANNALAEDYIKNSFLPDLNSMEPQDKEELKAQEKEALSLYRKSCPDKEINTKEQPADKIVSVVQSAIELYYRKNENDARYFRQLMIDDMEAIRNHTYEVLLFLVDFGKLADKEYIKRKNNPALKNIPSFKGASNLFNSPLLNALKKRLDRRSLALSEDQLLESQEFYKLLKKDEKYQKYIQNGSASFAEDQEVMQHIVKTVLFKSDLFAAYMESKDIFWKEDKAIVRSMASKTVKLITPDTLEEDTIAELSMNWEEDCNFFKKLYDYTLEHEKEFEALISAKTENWSKERITELDMLIMKLALAEMCHFPSIPVKVTINEFVELAKNYSTPKSKKFVNGVLDVLSENMQKDGRVRKSGRGLMDNK